MTLGQGKQAVASHAAKVQLFFSKFEDDRRYIKHLFDGSDTLISPCICGCANVLASWVSCCSHTGVLQIVNSAIERVKHLFFPYEKFSCWFGSALTAPQGEQLWRGNWQPYHIAELTALASIIPPTFNSDSWFLFLSKLLSQVSTLLMEASLSLRSLQKGRYRQPPFTSVPLSYCI
jgi:hypothetical protein